MTITGEVVVSSSLPPFQQAYVHLYLENVSYVDSGAECFAEVVLPGVNHPDHQVDENAETVIPFVMDISNVMHLVNQRDHYSIRAWLDRDGDGKPSPGDLYSDQSYPVLTRGHETKVRVFLAN